MSIRLDSIPDESAAQAPTPVQSQGIRLDSIPDTPKKGTNASSLAAQFGKGAYGAVTSPFQGITDQISKNPELAKFILDNSPSWLTEGQNAYSKVGVPQGIPEHLANISGQVLPSAAMASPFIRGAGAGLGLIPKVGPQLAKSAVLSGGLGLGAYQGAQDVASGNTQNVGQDMMNSAGQGALFGAAGRAGASIFSKLPAGERIGSAVGGAAAGGITSAQQPATDDEKMANVLFGAGLGALNPIEKYSVSRKIASSPHLIEHYGTDILDIPKADTTRWFERGADAIINAGKNNVPQETYDTLKQGDKALNYRFGKIYKKDLNPLMARTVVNPQEIFGSAPGEGLYSKILGHLNQLSDPNDPLIKNVEKKITTLNGAYSTGNGDTIQKLVEMFGINPKSISGIQEAGSSRDTGVPKQSITLEDLFKVKKSIYDMLSNQDFITSHPENDARVTRSIAKEIDSYINSKLPGRYAVLNRQYSNFKDMQSYISDLTMDRQDPNTHVSFRKLSVNPNRITDPSVQGETIARLQQLQDYFKANHLGQYDFLDRLKDYHTYQEWNSNQMASLRKAIVPKMLVGGTLSGLGGMIGGALAGPGGAKVGVSAGLVKTISLLTPKNWLPILKHVKKMDSHNSGINMEDVHNAHSLLELFDHH